MIPYFQLLTYKLGPLTLQVWGTFVALGMLVATWVGAREAKRRGLVKEVFVDFATWAILGGIVGGRLFFIFAYAENIGYFFKNPLQLIAIWNGGMSSIGGFIGAAVAVSVYCYVRKVHFLSYAHVAAYALPCGYGIGRIGCFLIHDHPGTLSNSLLAVKYPGGARLDHGLLLAIYGFVLFSFFLIAQKLYKKYPHNTFLHMVTSRHLHIFLVTYGLTRFLLDFYRAWDLPGSDVRYGGLTPAQYVGMAAVAFGTYFLFQKRGEKTT